MAVRAANTIGGTASGAGNVISGNTASSVSIVSRSSYNVVAGNLVGTNRADHVGAGRNQTTGVGIFDALQRNTIGATGNVISGGRHAAHRHQQRRHVLQRGLEHDFIGTDVTGTQSIANNDAGVLLHNQGDVQHRRRHHSRGRERDFRQQHQGLDPPWTAPAAGGLRPSWKATTSGRT